MIPRWIGWLAMGLLCCGLAGLTGSSGLVSIRSDRLLDAAERKQREFFGTSRPIRSDEWAVQLPHVRAQQLAEPPFPMVNLNEGIGALQRNTYDMPVLDWGVAFRPLTWPFFVRTAWSHGVGWFLREALLLLGLVWLASVFVARDGPDRRRLNLAAVAALAIFFSSAAMWWRSTVMIEFLAFAALAGAAGATGARANGGCRAGLLALSTYLWACSFCLFYPPVWAPVLWVVCALVIDAHLETARTPGRALVSAAPFIGAVAVGAAVGIFYHLPYLSLVVDTAYPGRRVAEAGTFSFARLIDLAWPSLTTTAPVRCGPEAYLGPEGTNVCEASAIEAIPLLLTLALALVSRRVRRAVANVVRARPASAIALLVLAAWLLAPLPPAFATLTLMRWSPAVRAWIGFGLGCALFAAGFIAELDADPQPEPRRWPAVALGAAVVLASAWAAVRHVDGRILADRCVARSWWPPMALAAIFLLAAVWWIGTRRGAVLLVAAWIAPIALANFTVNPLMWTKQLFLRGGGHQLVDAALARAPGRLVDYSTHPGATLTAFGWPLVGGVQEAPDLALFAFLTPDAVGLAEPMYNRYAHYTFVFPPRESEVPFGDVLHVSISPCSRRLAAIGVNHFLVDARTPLPAGCASDFAAADAGELQLWSRRAPVCAVGVARGTPAAALDFDYSCADPREARLEAGVAGFTFSAPGDPSRTWAVAMNPSVVDSIECTGATARMLDAHLMVHPEGTAPASCRGRYLDSPGALRRLLRR